MAKQTTKVDPGAETAPNAYTRRELEALSKSTGIDIGTLWAMPRRAVQQKAAESAAEAARLRAQQEQEAARVKSEKDAASRPLTERVPLIGDVTSYASTALPFLLPLLTRRYSGDQKLVRQWDKAITEAERAQTAARSGAGSLADATAATERAGAFRDQYKTMMDNKSTVGGLLKDASTIGGTTLAATELPVLPALIDKMQFEPGTRARDEADKKLTGQALLERLIAAGPITAGLSATGLKLGTLANRNPQTSFARTEAALKQSRPGWAEGPQTMGQNYAGAASAELPGIDARSNVASARRAAALLDQQPPKPRGLLAPEPQPSQMPPVAPQSPPPAAPAQSPSPTSVAQPTLPEPAALRQISPPATGATGELPPAGPWAQNWSGPAREAIDAHIAGGGSLAERVGLTGAELRDMIAARMMPGVKPPSLTETKDRLAALRGEVGPNPKIEDVKKVWVRDKDGRLFAIPAAMATGATGYGLLSPSDAEASGYYPDRGPRRGLLQLD